jgi:hypothetical protein
MNEKIGCLMRLNELKFLIYRDDIFKKMSSLLELAVSEPQLNRISTVQECDARMLMEAIGRLPNKNQRNRKLLLI